MLELGISEQEPDPPGGYYTRDPAGKLTGRAFEYANFRFFARLAQMVPGDVQLAQARDLFAEAVRFGVTSIQNMAIGNREELAALLRRAESPIRFRVIDFALTSPTMPWKRPASRLAGNVTVGGMKWIIDGTPIERSCAMREPYADEPHTRGDEDFSQAEMQAMLRQSLDTGEQLLVHIVGDRGVEDLIKAMMATGGPSVWSQRRVRVEHGEGIVPDLIPKVKELGIIVVQNPVHFTIGDLLRTRYGASRALQMQPVKSLLEARIPLAIGSDGPLNPYVNIMYASANPFKPGESLTRQQAVVAYTLQSAYAEFAEKEKGSLEPGKLADVVVL
jgi:predicted amidohydrolase YtcJ